MLCRVCSASVGVRVVVVYVGAIIAVGMTRWRTPRVPDMAAERTWARSHPAHSIIHCVRRL